MKIRFIKSLVFLFLLLPAQVLWAGTQDWQVSAETSLGTIELTGLAMADPEPLGDFEAINIPIKRANNLIIIEARINGLVGNFILDFGAPYLVLNKTYFRNYEKDYSRSAGGVNTGGSTALRTQVEKLEIRELFFEDVEADVTNLGGIENRRGIKVLGLLGVNLFKELDVEIDLKKSQVRIFKPVDDASEKEIGTPSTPDLLLDIDLYRNVILMKGEISGKRLRLSLDTGAEINLLDNKLPNRVFEAVTLTDRMVMTGATGGRSEVLAGTVKNVRIGELDFKDMRTVVTSLESMSNAYGFRIDGMLGYEFISRGVIRLNFKRKELKLYLYN